MSKNMLIKEFEYDTGLYHIVIENIRHNKNCFQIIKKIIKLFTKDEEMFFVFYRTDGVNISRGKYNEYQQTIKNFFNTHGSLTLINEHLSTAKITMDSETYKLLPYFFDYHLETTLFHPKQNWAAFKKYCAEYMKHRNIDYIAHGFADFLFTYFDSGDFTVCFNSSNYSAKIISEAIDSIISSFDIDSI